MEWNMEWNGMLAWVDEERSQAVGPCLLRADVIPHAIRRQDDKLISRPDALGVNLGFRDDARGGQVRVSERATDR